MFIKRKADYNMTESVRVLVADDELSLRMVLQTALNKAGYEVDTVKNGKEALCMAQENHYDVAILDIRMPEVDGLQAFYEIHKIKPNLPIILMTAFGSSETAVNAMKHGAYDYILKPFNLDEVKIIVSRAIRMQQLTKEVVYLTQEVQEMGMTAMTPGKIVGKALKSKKYTK